MSLTEQMTQLSTFAHLSFTLFRTHRMDFMCNQLYVDSHTMPFYLFQTGDDQLEKLFGKLRMLGAHNSAMSYQEAVARLGHACDLQSLFLRNPHLEQTPVRLNMTRSEHVDHLNMASWTGDATSGGCHAPTAWADGASRAAAIFQRFRFDPASYNYATIFASDDINMLQPLGDNKYPGVDNLDEMDASAIPVSTPAAASSPDASDGEAQEQDGEGEGEDDEGQTFVESLPQIPELELPQNRPGFNPTAYLDIGAGKLVHVKTICRLLLNLSSETKSLDRLKRVCGFKKLHSQRHDLDPDDIHGADAFVIGDLFLTLLRVESEVSLAVVRCTGIHNGTTSLGSTLGTTIRNPKAKIKITGQVLTMELIPTLAETDSALPQPLPATHAGIRPFDWTETPTSLFSWIWTGAYLVVDSAMAGTTQSTDKVVTVSVPGVLVEPIDPRMVDAVPCLGEDRAFKINSEGRTWEIDDGVMGAGCELLWEAVVEQKIAPKDIVAVKTSGGFPYSFSDGKPALLCQLATDQLTRRNEDKNRACYFCNAEKVANWRAHIGTHILRFLRGVDERLSRQFDIGLPCGFCGGCFAPECQVSLKGTQSSFQAVSNCSSFSDFQYGSANKGSATAPCRNVPVVCQLCHPQDHKRHTTLPAQWRYNMPVHLKTAHSDYASPLNPGGVHPLPHAVWESIRLGVDEEKDSGIPAEKRSAPFTNIAAATAALDRTDVVGKKRKAVKAIAPTDDASSSGKATKRRPLWTGSPRAHAAAIPDDEEDIEKQPPRRRQRISVVHDSDSESDDAAVKAGLNGFKAAQKHLLAAVPTGRAVRPSKESPLVDLNKVSSSAAAKTTAPNKRNVQRTAELTFWSAPAASKSSTSKTKSAPPARSSSPTLPPSTADPHKLVLNGRGGLNLQEQPDPVQDVLRLALAYNTGFHLTKGVYVPHAIKVGYAGDALTRAARDMDDVEMMSRLEDDRYRSLCSSLLFQRFGNVLTSFKTAADPTVNGQYDISHHMAATAQEHLKGVMYIFAKTPDTIDRMTGTIIPGKADPKKSYEHPALVQVIATACFKRGKLGQVPIGEQIMQRLPTHDGQIEVPAPMLAIAATAIHSSIDDWKTGAHVASNFDSGRFVDAYNTHLNLLDEIHVKNPVRYHNTMAAIFRAASGSGTSDLSAPSTLEQDARAFIVFDD
ncbi:hypothetical protein C8F01DRAFT_1255404 [Mycena amicta]|nr:hypothetical protein C8F01DRAFT_1255404 [Mycena amicta]